MSVLPTIAVALLLGCERESGNSEGPTPTPGAEQIWGVKVAIPGFQECPALLVSPGDQGYASVVIAVMSRSGRFAPVAGSSLGLPLRVFAKIAKDETVHLVGPHGAVTINLPNFALFPQQTVKFEASDYVATVVYDAGLHRPSWLSVEVEDDVSAVAPSLIGQRSK